MYTRLLPLPGRLCFGRVCLFVCLSARPSNYVKSNERICMKLLPEVCLGPRNNPLDFGNDPDYGPDRTNLYETFTKGVSWARDQSFNF